MSSETERSHTGGCDQTASQSKMYLLVKHCPNGADVANVSQYLKKLKINAASKRQALLILFSLLKSATIQMF